MKENYYLYFILSLCACCQGSCNHKREIVEAIRSVQNIGLEKFIPKLEAINSEYHSYKMQNTIRSIIDFIRYNTRDLPLKDTFTSCQVVIIKCIEIYGGFEKLEFDLVTKESKKFINDFQTWLVKEQSDQFEKDTHDLEIALLRIPGLESFVEKVKQAETVSELLKLITDVLLWIGNANNVTLQLRSAVRKVKLQLTLAQLLKFYESYASLEQKEQLMEITQGMTRSGEFAIYCDDTITQYFLKPVIPCSQISDELALEKIMNGEFFRIWNINDIILAMCWNTIQDGGVPWRGIKCDISQAKIKPQGVFELLDDIEIRVKTWDNLNALLNLSLQEKLREMRKEPLQFPVQAERQFNYEGIKFQTHGLDGWHFHEPTFAMKYGEEICGIGVLHLTEFRSDPEFIPFLKTLNESIIHNSYVTALLSNGIIDHVLESNALVIVYEDIAREGDFKISHLRSRRDPAKTHKENLFYFTAYEFSNYICMRKVGKVRGIFQVPHSIDEKTEIHQTWSV